MSGRHSNPDDTPASTPPDTPVDATLNTSEDGSTTEVTRHEERVVTGTEMHETGRVRVRKHIETYPVDEVIERSTEDVDTSEREPALEGDSGEVITLDDGSVSIPVFEEVLVVTKKLVVRERVIVRKHTVVDEHVLQTELRREHLTVDADNSVVVDTSALDAPHPNAPLDSQVRDRKID